MAIRRAGCLGRLVAGLVCVGLVNSAGAQGIQGFGQLQYQNVDGGGVKRESWVSVLQLEHATRWWQSTEVKTQFEFRRFAALGGPERNLVPRGLLQITHPDFGLNGYYRPSSLTDSFGLTSRQQEANLSGYFARAGLPHADFTWTRRHRSAGSSTGSAATGITRSAHLSHDLGPLNLQSGYNDLTQEPQDPRFRRTTQRTYNAGAGLRLFSSRRGSSMLRYEFTHGTNTLGSGARLLNITHEIAASGGVFLNARTDVSLGYSYRRSELRQHLRSNLNDHDGTLLLNIRPTRGLRFSGGGGVRTARTGQREDVLGSAIFSASAEGRVRPGWQGVSGVTHTISWYPKGHSFSVDSWHGGSRFRLNRGLEATADLVVSASGDTGNSATQVVSQASYGFNASPLRAFRLAWSGRAYRAGRSLGTATISSVGSIWDARWTPGAGLEIGAGLSRTSPLARGGAPVSTRQANLRWAATRGFQLSLNYSRSSQVRTDSGIGDLTGRELLGARVLWAPTRLTRVNAGFNTVDPGQAATRVRQFDVLFTQNFGR